MSGRRTSYFLAQAASAGATLARALAYRTVMAAIKTRFITAADLMPQIATARKQERLREYFNRAILGRRPLYRYADPIGALNLAVMVDGDELGWHYDQTDFVVSLAVQSSSAGAFWDNIGPGNPNSTSLASGAYLLKEWLALQGVPTLLAAFYVVRVRAWNAPLPRLLMLYWLATFASAVGMRRIGVDLLVRVTAHAAHLAAAHQAAKILEVRRARPAMTLPARELAVFHSPSSSPRP